MRYLKFTVFFILFYVVSLFCEKETEGFSIRRINAAPPLPFTNHGNALVTKEILKQPFYYLARGGQSFVFVSEDQKYVIKFFKNSPNAFVPLKKIPHKKISKLIRDIEGYLLAFERIPEESGLIFLKLDTENAFDQTVNLVDKLGIQHQLPLQKTLLQYRKRGSLFTPTLRTQVIFRRFLNL
jgi:hypothetical protein